MIEKQPNASYTEFTVQVQHQRFEGLAVSPVAGPGPQSLSIVRLFAPSEFLSVFWTATREGAAPLVPSHKSFQTNPPNRIFLGGARSGLIESVFGGHSYSVSGVWVFACSQVENLDSNFGLSMMPWENLKNTPSPGMVLGDFMIPAQNFINGILNPTPTLLKLPLDPDVLALGNQLAVGN